MKIIDEKLMIIDLVVDIESKINIIGFRSPKIVLLVKSGAPIKSKPQ